MIIYISRSDIGGCRRYNAALRLGIRVDLQQAGVTRAGCDWNITQMPVLIDTYSVHNPQAKVKLHQIDKLIFNCLRYLEIPANLMYQISAKIYRGAVLS